MRRVNSLMRRTIDYSNLYDWILKVNKDMAEKLAEKDQADQGKKK